MDSSQPKTDSCSDTIDSDQKPEVKFDSPSNDKCTRPTCIEKKEDAPAEDVDVTAE